MAVNLVQHSDGTASLRNEADSIADAVFGGPATPTATAPRYIVKRTAKVPLAALDTGGGVLSWQTPSAFAIIIDRITLDVTTKATAACTLDVGTTATTATTSSNNLLTGVDVGTAAGVFDNITDKGASGKSKQKVAASKWVTGSMASGAAAGLVGFAYIDYYPAT